MRLFTYELIIWAQMWFYNTIWSNKYKVPLRVVVELRSRGCRKLKRGSIIITRRPYSLRVRLHTEYTIPIEKTAGKKARQKSTGKKKIGSHHTEISILRSSIQRTHSWVRNPPWTSFPVLCSHIRCPVLYLAYCCMVEWGSTMCISISKLYVETNSCDNDWVYP